MVQLSMWQHVHTVHGTADSWCWWVGLTLIGRWPCGWAAAQHDVRLPVARVILELCAVAGFSWYERHCAADGAVAVQAAA
jgi:hypothetical protein